MLFPFLANVTPWLFPPPAYFPFGFCCVFVAVLPPLTLGLRNLGSSDVSSDVNAARGAWRRLVDVAGSSLFR